MNRPLLLRLFACVSVAASAVADVEVPAAVLNPSTEAEAWNVIRHSIANVERLASESRLAEIPVQISLCSPSLRALARLSSTPEQAEFVSKEASRALSWVVAISRTAGENNPHAVSDGLGVLKTILEGLAKRYDAKIAEAEIYTCPTHPEVLSADAAVPCGRCNLSLVPRRIPYSFVYTKPAEPTVTMTATPSAPCEAGREIEVKVRLTHQGKRPVLTRDLMVMHTQPIHLLIETPGLSDYHLVHPVATETPGEYAFKFTPAETSPYRIWADIVPHSTGLQELPFVDLPSDGKAAPPKETANRFSSTVEGYQFSLNFNGGNHLPIIAGQINRMSITVTDVQRQPVRQLEPMMNAFAHLVAISSDYQTVVHLHPTGGEILNPEARGGPALGVQFFPPKAGFMRLYCQVSIGGRVLLAPFGVNVSPAQPAVR